MVKSLLLISMLLISSCSYKNNSVIKEVMVVDEFDDIVSDLTMTSGEQDDAKKGEFKNLVNFVLDSKLSKEVKRYKSPKSLLSQKRREIAKNKSGIGSIEDTVIYKAANILKSEKCSLLKERKIIVRRNLTDCLRSQGKLPKLYRIYSYSKLKNISKNCSSRQANVLSAIKVRDSKSCYLENYKKGKFISPLNLLK